METLALGSWPPSWGGADADTESSQQGQHCGGGKCSWPLREREEQVLAPGGPELTPSRRP